MKQKTEQDDLLEWIIAIIDSHFPPEQTQMEFNKNQIGGSDKMIKTKNPRNNIEGFFAETVFSIICFNM